MSAAASLPAPRHGALREDVRTIGLIGLAHGTSHFFHLLLPPLFPWFIRDFGYSYAELGLLVSVFFAVSGIGQALAASCSSGSRSAGPGWPAWAGWAGRASWRREDPTSQ